MIYSERLAFKGWGLLVLLLLLLPSSANGCFGFEPQVHEKNDREKFAKIDTAWRNCDEMIVWWSVDKIRDVHPSGTGVPRLWPWRTDRNGKEVFFTSNDLLVLLKKEPHKGLLVIQLGGSTKSTDKALQTQVTELEPFISAVGYKRVLVLRTIGSPYKIQLLKDTQENELIDVKQKEAGVK